MINSIKSSRQVNSFLKQVFDLAKLWAKHKDFSSFSPSVSLELGFFRELFVRLQNWIDLSTQPITFEVMKCRIVASVITGLIPVTLMCQAKQGTL